MATADEVKAFIAQRLRKKLAAAGIVKPDDELNLIDRGFVDSFGLLDLLEAAEEKFGVQIDRSAVEIEMLSTFGGFAGIIAGAG